MPSLKFTVPGNPKGKERPRKSKHLKFSPTTKRWYHPFYTPATTHELENRIWLNFMKSIHETFYGNAIESKGFLIKAQTAERIRIDIKCFFGKKQHVDLDNAEKAVWDGLQGITKLGNDSRFFGSVDFDFDKENPRTEVCITWNQEEEK